MSKYTDYSDRYSKNILEIGKYFANFTAYCNFYLVCIPASHCFLHLRVISGVTRFILISRFRRFIILNAFLHFLDNSILAKIEVKNISK